MKTCYAYTLHWALCLGAIALASIVRAQETPTVNAAVEKNEVFVGEPFVFQIQVNNVGEAENPDLSFLDADFTIEFGGGKRNSSESISFINGRTTRVVSLQYLINYRLTPKRAGRIEIPAITLTVAGQSLTTQPLTIQVSPPEPVKDFKLSTSISKSECYVGEPISMTTTYYIGGEVRDVTFTLPVLSSTDFHSEPFAITQQRGKDYYQIPVNNEDVVAEKGEARLDGQSFVTLTFQHVLVPTVAGELVIPEATAAAQATVGRRRSRSPFDSMSPFGSRDDLRSVIVPADPLPLLVRPVPEEGKPANFSGLIGAFKLFAEATPTDVNVGDPITLTIAVEGSYYLRHFELPPLQQQAALAGKFRIPEEMAPGRAEENRKIFTQTIRAESADVTEIPPIELAYFDTGTGSYASASTKPIPLRVRETEVVTASDAEGYRQSVETVEHVAVNEGIAHNFTEPDALEPQYFGPDVWMRSGASWVLLLLPPIAWGALAGTVFIRRMGGIQPKGRARKMARAQFGAALAELDDTGAAHGKALQALRTYLAAKLDTNASALTYGDVERPLRAQGASDASLETLKRIFDECEAFHYAGAGGMPAAEVAAHVLECADALEKEIG